MKQLFVCFVFLFSVAARADFLSKTVTLDFSVSHGADPAVDPWQGVDLSDTEKNPKIISKPAFGKEETRPWQLRFIQAYVGTNEGTVVKIENSDFTAVKVAPNPTDPSSPYWGDEVSTPWSGKKDIYNPILMNWRDYFFFQEHLLAPLPLVFVLHTSDDHFAKIQFLDYVRNGRAIRNGSAADAETPRVEDGKTHIKFKYVYNTTVGDRSLDPNKPKK